MSTSDEDIYWQQVEAFIEQANTACDSTDPGIVAAALLNAAARFNAYVVAHASLDKNEFVEDIDGITQYLGGQFREHLKDHMADYREHYSEWIGARDADVH